MRKLFPVSATPFRCLHVVVAAAVLAGSAGCTGGNGTSMASSHDQVIDVEEKVNLGAGESELGGMSVSTISVDKGPLSARRSRTRLEFSRRIRVDGKILTLAEIDATVTVWRVMDGPRFDGVTVHRDVVGNGKRSSDIVKSLDAATKVMVENNKDGDLARLREADRVLQFRFKNEEPAAIEKARRNITKVIEDDKKKDYHTSDAKNTIAFQDHLKGLQAFYGQLGSPAQRGIMKLVQDYAEDAARRKVRPSVNLLLGVERDLKALDGASSAEVKTGSAWRTRFEQAKVTNILVAAMEHQWDDANFSYVAPILTDREAERGLARLMGFYNRAVKELGEERTRETICLALDLWIIAPEEVKHELMQDERLNNFLKDPRKYLAVYETKLAKDHGEDNVKVRAFRDEKLKNESRLKAISESRLLIFPRLADK